MVAPSTPPRELKHPYYPWDLKLPHYVPNKMTAPHILGVAAAAVVITFLVSWVITGRRRDSFCTWRRLSLCWMMVSALIHTVLEGYFSVYHATLAGHSTFLGEMWKEYSKSDSRYMSSDSFTVCMESITALIDGPLAFMTFWAFMKGSNSRYALQLIVSLFQLYGDVLYFMTEAKGGFSHGPLFHPVYFWFYFFFLNSLWIVIPILHIVDAVKHIMACQNVSDFYIDEYNRRVGMTNGGVKKRN